MLFTQARGAESFVAVNGDIAPQHDIRRIPADVATVEARAGFEQAVRVKDAHDRFTGLEPVGLIAAAVVVVAALS
jgi:hypothetical protein